MEYVFRICILCLYVLQRMKFSLVRGKKIEEYFLAFSLLSAIVFVGYFSRELTEEREKEIELKK